MHQIYNSDKPINQKRQDRFNRIKFSNRIADTIVKRQTEEGLVIGLYGIWGEGKSSVLNMIEEDLSQHKEILIVKFNPWRFKNEDALILNYFTNISITLDKELNSKKEKVGKFLSKYGSIGGVFNLDLSKIGESLFDADVEQLKERVNYFLKESEKKVVVIIDDIDRLDKQELFALFKLIKLTGDFSNTYYLLSFDDEMVASSIGERYAEGNKISGHNFLEKIIQVPLRIPKALSNDLLNYAFELINEVLKVSEIDLEQDIASTIGYQISQNLLLKINTPRLAIRYANSLSFLIPLLKGEVNIADLILFEGVKLFYAKHYDLIKNSPEYFIESYRNSFSGDSDKKKIEEFKQKLNLLNQDLGKKEQQSILSLLKHLFPLIEDPLDNHSYANGNQNWTKEKRIVSPKYFNRFFLYSVPENDISDVYFEQYLKELEHKEFKEVETETSEILKNIEATEFISKISIYQNELTWEQKKIIVKILCRIQDKFEGIKGGTFMLGFNPKSQVAITITKLLENHNNYNEVYQFTESLIKNINFEFSFEIIRWLYAVNKEKDYLIKKEDIQKLEEILLDRALADSYQNNSNLFQKNSNHIYSLLEFWHRKSPRQLEKYIDKCVSENKDFQETIIEKLTTTIYSSLYPEPYKTDFNKQCYEVLKKYYDVSKLYKLFSRKKYNKIRELEVKFFEDDKGYTLENAIRQFLHWYELDNNESNEQNIIDAEIIAE
jgi:predicted KAP-like P-loop ATPase